jgi:hypothetical protein
MIAVLLKPPEGSPKTRLNTADRIGIESSIFSDGPPSVLPMLCNFREYPTPPCDGVGPCRGRHHAHRGGGGSKPRSSRFLPTTPLFLVPNRVIIFNSGKPGQRDTGTGRRCRWTRAEACQGVCYLALRCRNVSLIRSEHSLSNCISTLSSCLFSTVQCHGRIH